MHDLIVEHGLSVPLPDGTRLAADVYRPAAPGRYPVILVRTPYDKLEAVGLASFGADPLAFARAGYAVVLQDTRGTFASEGTLRHFQHEADDGAAAIAWAAAQDWSDGGVAMTGPSYVGATQMLAATRAPEALKAVVPIITASEYYESWSYQGGALQLGFTQMWAVGMAAAGLARRETRGEDVAAEREALDRLAADPWEGFLHLPLVDVPERASSLSNYGEWLRHPDRDAFWRATAINERYEAIRVPALHIAGWFDIFLKGSLENFARLREEAGTPEARAGQQLIVGPWGHDAPDASFGDVWFGAASLLDLRGAYLEFFDTWLKGERTERAPVRIFVMGANRWRDEDAWPLARAVETRLHLRAGGGLTQDPPADEEPDTFVYDPRDPVPTVGGNTLLPGGSLLMGPRDRRAVQARPDVLVYATEPLTGDVEVTGPVTVRLHAATSARDTDFTAALVDLHPDGRALGVADGILRLRYRNGLAAQELAEPGQVHELEIDLAATSMVFAAGHRIQVEISSSNFPRFDRNPNHGGVIAEATASDLVPATQRVCHDALRPSYISLPVVR
jgi:putative CocE/NonD family hydrolase